MLLLATALLGCDRGSSEPAHRLTRASMAVRGVRPSLAELEAVADDPDQLEPIVTAWLDPASGDPRFGDTVRDMHAEQFLVRIDTRDHLRPLGPLDGWLAGEIAASLDEEPLQSVARVVTEGRPYTDIVTSDLAMADAVTATAHGLAFDPAFDPGGPAWQPSTWADDRPDAGILSSTSLLQRHMSSNVNNHRSRANFVLSQLLCMPFPAGAVASKPLTDGVALADDPACVGCHQRLDPLASAFYGFRDYVLPSDNATAEARGCAPASAWACTPLGMWDADRIALRDEDQMPPPALLGSPVTDLADLGRQIAARPEFASCTARRFAGYLAQVPPSAVPADVVEALTDTLLAADFDARQVVLQLVLDPDFLDGRGWVGPQRVRPEQLSRMIEDLTGWRWTRDVSGWGEVDMLDSDAYGHRLLMGGINGWGAVEPVHAPTASRELVLERVAHLAADHAVDAGVWPPGGVVTGRREVRRALEALSLRITADGADVDALQALFDDALARSGQAGEAWKVVITALLLDPDAERY